MNATAWRITLCAALLMGLVTGGRAAGGLFLSPLNTATGFGLAGLSLALAFGQLGVGLLQPVIGAVADRLGAARIIVCGALLLAAATALPAVIHAGPVVALALAGGTVAGGAVGSNGLLLGVVNRRVPPERAGFAVALVGAGGSAGQLVLGPATQWLIDGHGWSLALVASGLFALVAIPLALAFRRPTGPASSTVAPPVQQSLAGTLRDARFWRVAGSFGVCGFHVAFLTVHMPGVIERCGFPSSLAGSWVAVAGAANIAGSLAIGLLLRQRDAARLLAGVYLLRAAGVAGLLLLPASTGVMLAFALAMGATHMATLPPTSQLVARHHGVARMGALFGVVMVVHQAGSFAGISLGGWAAQATGSDTLLWTADIALALLAAALVWPLRARGVARTGEAQASGPGSGALVASR